MPKEKFVCEVKSDVQCPYCTHKAPNITSHVFTAHGKTTAHMTQDAQAAGKIFAPKHLISRAEQAAIINAGVKVRIGRT
jgi:ribosomal protein L13E